MGTTSLGLVYPDSTDSVDVAGDIQALADATNALLLSKFTPLYRRKAADQAKANTTTLADDNNLVFTNLPASRLYAVESFLITAGSTTGDFKVNWSCSGVGAAFDWAMRGLTGVATGLSDAEYHGVNNLAGTETIGTVGAATKAIARPAGLLETGTGSNISFAFRWAQGAIDAVNGTTLFAKSTIWLIPLA